MATFIKTNINYNDTFTSQTESNSKVFTALAAQFPVDFVSVEQEASWPVRALTSCQSLDIYRWNKSIQRLAKCQSVFNLWARARYTLQMWISKSRVSLYEAVTLAGQRFSSEEKESKIGISPSKTQRKITFKFEIGDPLLLRSIVKMKLMAHGYDSMVWGERWIKKRRKKMETFSMWRKRIDDFLGMEKAWRARTFKNTERRSNWDGGEARDRARNRRKARLSGYLLFSPSSCN